MSSRHRCRMIAVQSLYEWDFLRQKKDWKEIFNENLKEFGEGIKEPQFVEELIKGVIDHIKEIDAIITQAAPHWPMEKMGIVDRNILRLGVYELLFGDKKAVPPKVAIDEAIELAKEFSGENTGKFVNGVLGAIYREYQNLEKETQK